MRKNEWLIPNMIAVLLPWLEIPFLWCVFYADPLGDPRQSFQMGKFVGLCFLCFIYALLLLLGHQSFWKNAEKISWICLIVGLAESFIALPVIALRSIPYEIDTIILRDFPFSVFLALFMFVIYLLLLVRKIKMRTKITG